jgi:hypothetical protein
LEKIFAPNIEYDWSGEKNEKNSLVKHKEKFSIAKKNK